MNAKSIVVGAVAFWLVTNVVGMFGTGFLIHGMILDPVYKANSDFWVPALRQDPPDMGALLPHWLLMSFVNSIVVAGIYTCVRGSFKGSGARRGFTWGLSLGIFAFFFNLSYSGYFNLPFSMWVWWSIDVLILFAIGGAAMGWAAGKFADA